MRGWSSIVVGVALLGLAAWAQMMSIHSGVAISFGLAGAFLIFRGFQGAEITEAGDPTALGDFISDPAGALVDAAVDKADERSTARRAAAGASALADAPSDFDPDAALARYMANRPPPQPEAAVDVPAPARGFGRKGL